VRKIGVVLAVLLLAAGAGFGGDWVPKVDEVSFREDRG